MLYDISYVMLYNMCYVVLDNICYMRFVKLYNMLCYTTNVI